MHPHSVPAVLDAVDARLHDLQRPGPLLRPAYSFAELVESNHPALKRSPPLPEDRVQCRSISPITPQNTSADIAFNRLVGAQLDRFKTYEYINQPVPYYEAAPAEHALLLKLRGQVEEECQFRPRRFTRTLMRKVFDQRAKNG